MKGQELLNKITDVVLAYHPPPKKRKRKKKKGKGDDLRNCARGKISK